MDLFNIEIRKNSNDAKISSESEHSTSKSGLLLNCNESVHTFLINGVVDLYAFTSDIDAPFKLI